jgi:hypothetical protein
VNEVVKKQSVFFDDIKNLIEETKSKVSIAVNSSLTLLYWSIGRRINDEILGNERADYGEEIVLKLSKQLIVQYGRGYSKRNLLRAPLKTLDIHNNTDLNLGKENFRRTSKLIQGSLTKHKFKSVLPVGWHLKGSSFARYFLNLATARLKKSLTKPNPFKYHYECLGFLEVP